IAQSERLVEGGQEHIADCFSLSGTTIARWQYETQRFLFESSCHYNRPTLQ
ncbi:hypothetical protein KI387_017980, partial [Taxus chinensis]